MKKNFSVLLIAVFLSVSMVCSAQISQDEVALGGIKFGSKREYVESVYGQPTTRINRDGGVLYDYNGTFQIFFASGKYMYWMKTTANNGIGTPSGVKVGMDVSVLERYGEIYHKELDNGVIYYYYWAPSRITLDFGVVDGKIVSIRARC